MQWLGLANYRVITRKGLREALETPVHIDIIDNYCAARSQGSPRPIHLKANVALTVEAVMNEKIDLAELRNYGR